MCLVSLAIEVQLYRKFTPVYTQTECGNQTATMDRLALGVESIEIGMQIEVTCRNPNPYAIEILASTPGQVFVQFSEDKHAEKVQLGNLRVLPGSSLGENSGGVVRVRMDTEIKGTQADTMLPHFLSETVPIMMLLQFDVGVSISFGLGSWSVSAPFKKSCGLNMGGVLVNQFLPEDNSKRSNRLGPLICRDSFDGLLPQLPRVGEKAETPEDGNMGFSAAQVAPQEVEAGELLKTVSLGASIAMSFFSFVVLSLGSFAVVAHAGGLHGLVSDMRTGGCCCGSSFFRLLGGHAWNGVLDTLASSVSVIGISVAFSGLRVPAEKLQVPKVAREEEPKSCPRSVWLWRASVGKEELETPQLAEPDGARWLRRLLLDRTPVSQRGFGSAPHAASASPTSCPAKANASSGYHRLSTVAGDVVSPPRNLLQSSNLSPRKASHNRDDIIRSTTAPLLSAVSARRAELVEASGSWGDERPPSPLPRPPRSDHQAPRWSRTSSAPYVVAGDSVSVASVASPTSNAAAVHIGSASPQRHCSSSSLAVAAGSPVSAAFSEQTRAPDLARSAAFEEDPAKRWKARLNEPGEVPERCIVTV
jgi:hypothetical protein